MALLDTDGRLWNKLHWLDALILGGLLLAVVGGVAVKLGSHKTAKQAMSE